MTADPSPYVVKAMFTPSLVLAYWTRGSMVQPFYDMAGLFESGAHSSTRAHRPVVTHSRSPSVSIRTSPSSSVRST